MFTRLGSAFRLQGAAAKRRRRGRIGAPVAETAGMLEDETVNQAPAQHAVTRLGAGAVHASIGSQRKLQR
jgi:hypothetical protein